MSERRLRPAAVVLAAALTTAATPHDSRPAAMRESDSAFAAAELPAGAGSAAGAAATPITTVLTILEASDRRVFAGRRVVLGGVRIQQVIGVAIALVGPDRGQTLAVRAPAQTSGLPPGSSVYLEGTVRTVPAVLDGWALDEAEQRALRGRQVFIEATVLRPEPAPGS